MCLLVGIFVILGSTYTGHYEPVQQISDILDKYQEETGIDIPIHVDGASGAMFCPFATPSVKFGFEIPRVKSINTYPPENPFSQIYFRSAFPTFVQKASVYRIPA